MGVVQGILNVHGDGSFTYTPPADFSGTVTFEYEITDGASAPVTATVTINVMPVNDAPVAVDDEGTTDEEETVTVDVLGNDSDLEGDSLEITDVGTPVNGTAALNPDHTITYTPNPDFHGDDSFTYTVSDGHGGTASATVAIVVNPVNDPPVAADDGASTSEDESVDIDVLANDGDPEDDPLTPVIVAGPTNGTATVNPDGTITYTPNANFHGDDEFSYVVTDGESTSNEATVTIVVHSVLDRPLAEDDAAVAIHSMPVTVDVLANDSSPEGLSLTLIGLGEPAHGTAWIESGLAIYKANQGYFGADSFSYTIADSEGLSASGTVSIEVLEIITLDESYLYGWEAQDFNFIVLASTSQGTITEYQFDLDNDGEVDSPPFVHDAELEGALEFDLALLDLIPNSNEDGAYPVMLRITTDAGIYAEFDTDVSIGNMPPLIEFGAGTDGDPGIAFTLEVTTTDPGDDTVTQIVIDWGDGSSSMIVGGSGNSAHTYSTDGQYVIRATATDEDDSYWAEVLVNIGVTDAEPVESDDPVITAAISTILENGNAELTVDAVDHEGSPSVTYEWDLDGDGIFEHSGTPTVELPAGTDYYPYMATVRVTDAIGRVTEALFAFAQAGGQTPQAKASNYSKLFREATPDAPPDWPIHHTKQQVLEKRYLAAGINVHDKLHLRAVPPSVHKEINAVQLRWWAQKAREGKTVNDIPLAEVVAFEAQIDAEFGSRWIKAGPNQAEAVAKVKNLVKNGAVAFGLSKGSRWRRLGLSTLAAIPLVSLLADNAESFDKMRQFDPDTHEQFKDFMEKYEYALTEAMNTDRVSKRTGEQLVDSMIAFGESMAVDSNALIRAKAAMYKGLDEALER